MFANSNDVGVLLGEMTEQTAVTYALMFEAPRAGKRAAYRKLEVKLVGGPKGARVIHRRGYYAPAAASGRDPGGR